MSEQIKSEDFDSTHSLSAPNQEQDPLYEALETEDPYRFKATILTFIFCTLGTDTIGIISSSQF